MKKLKIFLLFLMMVIPPAFAESPYTTTQDASFNRWVTYYYMDKDPSKIEDFLLWLQNGQIFEKHPTTQRAMAAFFSILFKDNPTRISSWIKATDPKGKTKEAIKEGLWLSGHKEMISTFFSKDKKIEHDSLVEISNLHPRTPDDLDVMWSAFFASGDNKYVEKIINVLDENTPLLNDKISDMLTRTAAQWSLTSNMLQHELVNRLVRKKMKAYTGSVKQKLVSIVDNANKRIGEDSFPNKDGEFSAMILIINEDELKEFDKPSTEGMSFKEKTKAKRGNTAAIKILFAGMGLSEDLSADVSFDMKILNPKGEIYGGSEAKGLLALKTRVPMRFSIFDNNTFIKIRFEPEDILGEYKIITTIHDNIENKHISLEKTIELIE